MKRLFKFLFGIVIFVVILVGVPVGVSYYFLVDNVDESPLELYDDSVSFESELSHLFDSALDLNAKTSINLSFTEEQLNKLIFAMLRQNKPTFNPNSTNEEDKYIQTFDLGELVPDVAFLQGKKAYIKNVYAKIENDELRIFLTLDLFGVKSRAKLAVSFSEDEDAFKLEFKTLGIGKANLLSGLAKKALDKVFELTNFSSDNFNDQFAQAGLPFTLDIANFTIEVSKDKLQMLVEQLINPNDMAESSEKDILTEFVATLSSKQNDLINFGIFSDDTFGLQFDLTKFMVNPSTVTLDQAVTTFDQDTFIMNKVQNFIISNIVPSGNPKMAFSNNDFNAIIYDQSNAYQAFNIDIPLPNSTSTFTIRIIGILIDFNDNDVKFRVNVNLNGLTTSLVLTGNITQNNGATVRIKITDTITLGEDPGEVAGQYITANANLIMSLLGDNISNMGLMQYDATNKTFVLTAASFQQLMQLDGSNVSPLTVDKLKIVDNAIEVYCTINPADPFFAAMNQATTALQNALANTNLDISDFNATSPEEQAAVQAALDALDAVSDGLNGGTLDEAATNALIDAVNGMSPENQQTFLAALEANAASPDLISLYDSLFGLD